ncbi:MAG: acyltransferase [Symploca sp. SIO2E9]|nr:acyltransferase [Symploca sp. SIO2E9]
MNAKKTTSTSRWHRWKEAAISRWLSWQEAIVFFLLAGTPTPLGRVLRRLGYRTIFAQLGKSAWIRVGIHFEGAARIKMGDLVSIHPGVRIRSLNQKSMIVMADKVSLDRGVDIKSNRGEIAIGKQTYIGPYTCLSGGDIKIGDNCLIASHSGIYANNHSFADPLRPIRDQGSSFKGIVIEDDCWLGSGVRVLDGVTIAKGSVIGAGAVVTKDIPPYSVAVGVPAKVVSHRKLVAGKPVDEISKAVVAIQQEEAV